MRMTGGGASARANAGVNSKQDPEEAISSGASQ